MKRRFVVGCLGLVGALASCSHPATKPVAKKPAVQVAPAKPPAITMVQPARYVLLDSVGGIFDEALEASPVQAREPVIVNGRRLMVEGGQIFESALSPDNLRGFRSLPPRLGGGYIVWSEELTYHTPTFLGKLTPFAKIGTRGGVRPWFDSFVLRTTAGPLEVNSHVFPR
jgi:hypothetical protein